MEGVFFVIGLLGLSTGGTLAYNIWQEQIYLTSPHPVFLCVIVGFYVIASIYLIVSALIFRISLGK